MASGVVDFGHDGFETRANCIRGEVYVESVGENVAYSYGMPDPLSTAVVGWMKSPGHRKNILGNFTHTGVAIVYNKEGRCYLTQMFARQCEGKRHH